MANEKPQLTVAEVARLCKGRLVTPGPLEQVVIRGVAALSDAGPETISWISDSKHAKALATTKAAAVVGNELLVSHDPRGIVVADPDNAIANILDALVIPVEAPALGVHPTAIVHASAKIDSDASIGAYAIIHAEAELGAGVVIHEGVTIGRGVRVGDRSVLFDQCVVYDRCEVGQRVIIHAGAVIGADGFGYIFRDGRHRKLAHLGNVVIEDDVEIGANTCIDRGKLGSTRIGRGTKIDNLVMIAHNVQIGPLCVITGQCGVSGSVKLGAGSAMGGQSGITHGVTLGNEVRIAAKSIVISDVESGSSVMGIPARNKTDFFREQARLRQLNDLFKEVARLTHRVEELEAAANHSKHG